MPKVSIDRLISNGVENIFPSKEALKEKLLKGDKIRLYLGIDPTAPTLHLGHTVNLRKLAEFQELGHEVILLIGDFTAMIGDPTDKSAVRKQLTKEEVLENCKLYKKQASKFLKFSGANAAKLMFNSKWLAKMSFQDVIGLASHFTVQQLLERDMFQARMKEKKPIHLHEFLYPLMQGYDSVAMDVDLEVGGNDQTFNMLAGRDLQSEINHKSKYVMAMRLLVDSTGKKMGKSEGNMIALTDSPDDMYGKVMSWTDGMILPGFEICTDKTEEQLEEVRAAIKKGENPMQWKRYLAHSVVTSLTDDATANRAAENFSKVHQEGARPTEIPELKVKGSMSLIDVLVESGLCTSKTDARRQIEQGGVKVNDEVMKDVAATVSKGSVIQKGKRHFVKLV